MRPHWILLAALMPWPGSSAAQETTGNIQGRLLDAAHGPVVSAQISATRGDLLGVRRTTSVKDGVLTLLALPRGSYTLRIAAIVGVLELGRDPNFPEEPLPAEMSPPSRSKTLMATRRSSRRSRPRSTSAIPPRPSSCSTVYRPARVPWRRLWRGSIGATSTIDG